MPCAACASGWHAAADELVERVVGTGEREFDAVPELAEAFPLRVFPDAVGIPTAGRENLLPYGEFAFNAFGPPNELVAAGAPRVPELSAWVSEQCVREVLSDGGFGAQIWAAADRGDITHEQAPLIVRSLLTAGVDTTVHGLGAVLHAFATTPASGSGCAPSRRSPASRSTRPSAGSRRCRRSTGPPPPTSPSRTW